MYHSVEILPTKHESPISLFNFKMLFPGFYTIIHNFNKISHYMFRRDWEHTA